MRSKVQTYFLLPIFLVLFSGCPFFLRGSDNLQGLPLGGKGTFSYQMPANINLSLSSGFAGAAAEHTLSFDIQQGDLQTYQAVITYPSGFTFNGFLSLGAAGTQIGTYSFAVSSKTHTSFPVYSIDDNNAYGDIDLTNTFNNQIDPFMVYSNNGGNHLFTITAPFGGDADAGTNTGQASATVTSVMNSGILTNPSSAGTVSVQGNFTSVDPDTGDADNSSGNSPLTLNSSENVMITSAFIIPAITAWGLTVSILLLGGLIFFFQGKRKYRWD